MPGPFSAGEQSSIGTGTKRMTLARVVRILVVLVLPPLLLLIVDGSRAQAYPREIKPGERGLWCWESTACNSLELMPLPGSFGDFS